MGHLKAIPLPPRGMTIDQIQQYSRMRGRGEGARQFLEDVERMAAVDDDNTLRGDALESLVRLALSIDPTGLLGRGQVTALAHTSIRRANENVAGWTRDDLWQHDKEVLRTIDPTHATLLEDARGSGFDLVGTYVSHTAEKRFVVQCKNTEAAPSASDINAAAGTWPGERKVGKRLLIGHRGKLSNAMLAMAESKGVTCVSSDDLCENITAEFWYRWAKGLREGNLEREADNERIPEPFGAAPEATAAAMRVLQDEAAPRTNLSMATGTGKTRVGADVGRALATGGRVVVAVPTRELADQTIKHWSRYTPSNVRLRVGLLSSSSGATSLLRRQGPLGEREVVPVDTFPARGDGDSALAEWWHAPVASDEITLLVTTYHSSWRLKPLSQTQPVDLLVVDEAHHTGGERSAPVSRKPETYSTRNLLDDTELRAHQRLFMTATPRDSGPVDPTSLDAGVSMTSVTQYGKRAYSIALGEARERGLIKSYGVKLDILVEDPEYTGDNQGILSAAISRDIRATSSMHGNELHVVVARRSSGDLASLRADTNDKDTLESQKARARTLAMLHTHAQSVGKHKRAILFVSRIAEAREAETFINTHLRDMAIDGAPVTAFRLTSDVNIAQRRESLDKSASNDGPTVLVVVRTGQEGVDLPQVDQLTFGGNTKSQEAILQKVGRGVRLDKRSGAANQLEIYIPVLARCDESGRVVITDDARRSTALQLQAALASVDPAYENDFDAMLRAIEDELERQQQAMRAERAPTPERRESHPDETVVAQDTGLTREVATLSLRGLASQLSYAGMPLSTRDAMRAERRREIREVAEGIRAQLERDPDFVVPFGLFHGSKSPARKRQMAEALECSVETLENVMRYARGVKNDRIANANALAFGEDWDTLVQAGFTVDPKVQVQRDLYRTIERMMLASPTPGFRIPGNPKNAPVNHWPDNASTSNARRRAIDTVFAERTGTPPPKRPEALAGLDVLYAALGETGDEAFGMAMRRLYDNGQLYASGDTTSLYADIESAIADIVRERGYPFVSRTQPWGESLRKTLAFVRIPADNKIAPASPTTEAPKESPAMGSALIESSVAIARAGILATKGAWSPYYPLETLLLEEFTKLKEEEGEDFPFTAEIVDGLITRLEREGRFAEAILPHIDNGKLHTRAGRLPGPIIAMAIRPLPDSLPIVRAIRMVVALPQFADQREAFDDLAQHTKDPGWERSVASSRALYPVDALSVSSEDRGPRGQAPGRREARLVALAEAATKPGGGHVAPVMSPGRQGAGVG